MARNRCLFSIARAVCCPPTYVRAKRIVLRTTIHTTSTLQLGVASSTRVFAAKSFRIAHKEGVTVAASNPSLHINGDLRSSFHKFLRIVDEASPSFLPSLLVPRLLQTYKDGGLEALSFLKALCEYKESYCAAFVENGGIEILCSSMKAEETEVLRSALTLLCTLSTSNQALKLWNAGYCSEIDGRQIRLVNLLYVLATVPVEATEEAADDVCVKAAKSIIQMACNPVFEVSAGQFYNPDVTSTTLPAMIEVLDRLISRGNLFEMWLAAKFVQAYLFGESSKVSVADFTQELGALLLPSLSHMIAFGTNAELVRLTGIKLTQKLIEEKKVSLIALKECDILSTLLLCLEADGGSDDEECHQACELVQSLCVAKKSTLMEFMKGPQYQIVEEVMNRLGFSVLWTTAVLADTPFIQQRALETLLTFLDNGWEHELMVSLKAFLHLRTSFTGEGANIGCIEGAEVAVVPENIVAEVAEVDALQWLLEAFPAKTEETEAILHEIERGLRCAHSITRRIVI